MMKLNIKNDTTNESQLQKINSYLFYPRDSKIYSDKRFVNTNNGEKQGTHWVCNYIKDNKSYYFDSLGGQPEKLLLNQLPKPVIYHDYKIQDINSNLCGSYCLSLFYLIERMDY